VTRPSADGRLTWIKAASLQLRKKNDGKTKPVVQAAGAGVVMATTQEQAGDGAALALPVRKVTVDQPWNWLSKGWADLRLAWPVSLTYGAAFVIVSLLLTFCLWITDLLYLVLPLAAGFMFLGPVVCVGLYEVSQRLERGEPATLQAAIMAWREHAGSIAVMGLVLMLFLLAWIRIAFLIFALFFGGRPASWEFLITTLFFTTDGIPFLIVGSLVGGVLAVVVFAISAVALPLLLDRDAGVLRAIVTSIAAVAKNWRVLIGWAALIVLFTAAGLVTFYIGLAVTLPLIGHASWHAYRDLVQTEN
jgi:uncharacterized membrane protein